MVLRASSAWNALRGRQIKYDSLDLFREIYGGRESWAGKSITLNAALQVSTALACGRVIAEGNAMLPWKVHQITGKNIRQAVEHPIFDKLYVAPNPMQTAFEFQETMGLHLAFCGNAYVWMPSVSRRVDAMYLLEPRWVTVKYRWPDMPTYDIRMEDGRMINMTSAEIWHIRGPSWCSYTGLEFMHLAREALGLSIAIEEGQAKMHANGVRSSGTYAVDGTLTDEQHKKLKIWLEREHEGSQNAGRPMVLDRAAKWLSTSMTNVDAQTLEQRGMQVEEVCRFMRVLPIMVGHSDKTATYASSEQMFLAHSMYTSGPWARRLEQSADRRLLSKEDRAAGYYTKLNEKAILRMTSADQINFLSKSVLSGIMTRNEARDRLDMNPIDGLDEPLAPANTFLGNPPDPAAPKDPQPK